MKSSAEKIAMKSYEDILSQPTLRGNLLKQTVCHLISFSPSNIIRSESTVRDKMQEMVESIKQNGVLIPILSDQWQLVVMRSFLGTTIEVAKPASERKTPYRRKGVRL